MLLLVFALLIEALLIALVGMSGSVVESILLLLVINTVYLAAVYRVLQDGWQHRGRQLLIITAALVFRLTAAPLAAPFSDDLHRYRWEAQVQDAGGNPYQAFPADPRWQQLRDATYARVPGKDFRAVYGPAWEWLSLWTWRAVRHWTPNPDVQLLWLKAPAAVFDLATVAVLYCLLRMRGTPGSRVLIYAWSPLPVWEFWGNGHNDAVLLFFLLAAIALMTVRRKWIGSAALGVSLAVKWWPVLLLPAFVRVQRDLRPILIAGAVVACFSLPFLADIRENAQFASGFVGGWRNNDSIFGGLLYLTGDQYAAKYLAFACIGIATVFFATRDWPLERVALWTIVAMLLLSANCHPWYLTWFVPFLAFYPHPSLLLWTALMPFSYAVLIRWQSLGEWVGSTPDRWWIYLPVFGFMFWEGARAEQRITPYNGSHG